MPLLQKQIVIQQDDPTFHSTHHSSTPNPGLTETRDREIVNAKQCALFRVRVFNRTMNENETATKNTKGGSIDVENEVEKCSKRATLKIRKDRDIRAKKVEDEEAKNSMRWYLNPLTPLTPPAISQSKRRSHQYYLHQKSESEAEHKEKEKENDRLKGNSKITYQLILDNVKRRDELMKVSSNVVGTSDQLLASKQSKEPNQNVK